MASRHFYPTEAVGGDPYCTPLVKLWYGGVVPIAGERPETGVRIHIARDKAQDAAPWTYAGAAHLPGDSFPVTVTVDAAGEVAVTLSPSAESRAPAPADLAEKVRLIVRTVYRQAKADDEPPAWRIVRWRGEK